MKKLLIQTFLWMGILATGVAWAAEDAALQVRFRNVFSDHMVLQRDKPLRFAGVGKSGCEVTVDFHGRQVKATCDQSGAWEAELSAEAAGGPYTLSVSCPCGKSETLTDIYVGELWICSGQSNMEMPVWGPGKHYRLPDGDKIAASAHDPSIRLFQVPHRLSPLAPQADAPEGSSWKVATNAPDVEVFSATGWWFGQHLRQVIPSEVKIGLVNASWGGTRIRAWTPLAAFDKVEDRDVFQLIEFCKGPIDMDQVRKASRLADLPKFRGWLERFNAFSPAITQEARSTWSLPDADLSAWKRIDRNSVAGLSSPGVAWYRFDFDITEEQAGNYTFHIDCVNDADETYCDGILIGNTLPIETEEYWSKVREYPFTVKAGHHALAIRAIDHNGPGFVGEKVQIRRLDGSVFADFSQGEWCERVEFRVGSKLGDRPRVPGDVKNPIKDTGTPATLWNGMVSAFSILNARGVIWYQGESDDNNSLSYAAWQRRMIDGWRAAFRDPNLVFALTQISAMDRYEPDTPHASDFWKKQMPEENLTYVTLRAIQMELLDYPLTGLACTIDIGEDYDIHPKNKNEVGRRLVLEALRLAYGETNRLAGPVGLKAVREGAAVKVTIDRAGQGLTVRGGTIGAHLFALADADGRWHWADGTLEDGATVRVTSAEVAEPTAVRWCWNGYPPEANLHRKDDGLPVFPFELSVTK